MVSVCLLSPDDLNTLNIKLFPTYPPPPPVKAWQVPLFTVRYETLMDENWDLTMQRVRIETSSYFPASLKSHFIAHPSGLTRNAFLSDRPTHQWHILRPHHLPSRRCRLLPDPPRYKAPPLLWLSPSPRHLLIQRHLRPHSTIQLNYRFGRRHAARMRQVRQHCVCSRRTRSYGHKVRSHGP